MTRSPFPVLTTERLTLREITHDDIPALREIFGDEKVTRYMSDTQNPLTSTEELGAIVDWAHSIYITQTGVRWGITLTGENQVIGTCGFHGLNHQHRYAEMGYDLAHAHWHKGIMSEALRKILAYGFGQAGLHRIEANVTEGNEASVLTLLRLGFQPEGSWRERVYLRGQFHNLMQFGLLESEYAGRS